MGLFSTSIHRRRRQIVVVLLIIIVFVHTYMTATSASGKPNVETKHSSWKSLLFDDSNTRMNATFVSLVRNRELTGMLNSIRSVEERFNRDWNYDWVFLNDEEFTAEFKDATTTATSGRARYGKVDADHWSFPPFVDMSRAEQARANMKDIMYGDSISYRHMCRWQSGFFYRHPLLLEYAWYWRVEPNIEILCDVPYDPFRWMAENGKKYSFVITPTELEETIPSLWRQVKGFIKAYPEHIAEDGHLDYLSDDKGETWRTCHFWSNFEIASLDWFRSQAYSNFFNYLDSAGGFFYERWGDAPVHTIAAALMLERGEIHFFDDFGYSHHPYKACPWSQSLRQERNCRCKPEENAAWISSNPKDPLCLKRFFDAAKLEYPRGIDRDGSRVTPMSD